MHSCINEHVCIHEQVAKFRGKGQRGKSFTRVCPLCSIHAPEPTPDADFYTVDVMATNNHSQRAPRHPWWQTCHAAICPRCSWPPSFSFWPPAWLFPCLGCPLLLAYHHAACNRQRHEKGDKGLRRNKGMRRVTKSYPSRS